MGVRWCVFDCYAGRFVVSFKFIGDIFAAIVVAKSEYLASGVAVLSFGATYEILDSILCIELFG